MLFLLITSFIVVFVGFWFAALLFYILQKRLFEFHFDSVQRRLGTHPSRGTPVTINESSSIKVNTKSNEIRTGIKRVDSLPCYKLQGDVISHSAVPSLKHYQIDQIDEAGRRYVHLIPMLADQLARLRFANSSSKQSDEQGNRTVENEIVEKVKLGQLYCVVCGNRHFIFSIIEKAKARGKFDFYVECSNESNESNVQVGIELSEDGYEIISATEKEK